MSIKALPPIGPGVGSLAVGLAWTEFDRSRSTRVGELESALMAVRDRLLLAEATQSASRELANAMVDELQAEAAGRSEGRRLSDPSKGELRRAYVVVRADAELRSRSLGRLHGRADEVKAARAIVAKGLKA